MRKFVAILALLLTASWMLGQTVSMPGPFVPQAAGGSVSCNASLKCTASTAGSSVSSLACSPGTLTSGSILLVGVATANGASTTVTMSDTLTSTFTLSQAANWRSGSNTDYQYYVKNTGAGADTVTASLSTAEPFSTLMVQACTGANTSTPADGTPTFGTTISTGTVNSGNITTAGTNDVVWGMGDCDNSSGTVTGGAGFTVFSTNANTCTIGQYKIVGAPGTYSNTVNVTGTPNVVSSVSAFKP